MKSKRNLIIGIVTVGIVGGIGILAIVSNAATNTIDSSPKETYLKNAIAKQLNEEAANTHGTPRPPVAPPALPAPVSPTGIFNTNEVPFANMEFEVSNAYAVQVGNELETVYAGATRDPGSGVLKTGAVRVYLSPTSIASGGSTTYVGQFVYPAAAGIPLSVATASGNVITLKAGPNISMTFDLESHVFG